MPFAGSTAAPCPAHVLAQPQSQEMDFFSHPKGWVLFAPQNAQNVLLPLLGTRAEKLLEPPMLSSDGEMEKFSGAAETFPLQLEIGERLLTLHGSAALHKDSEGRHFPLLQHEPAHVCQ